MTSSHCAWVQAPSEIMARLTAAPAKPMYSSGLRPMRSIKAMPTSVMRTLTTPMPMVARIWMSCESNPASLKTVGA